MTLHFDSNFVMLLVLSHFSQVDFFQLCVMGWDLSVDTSNNNILHPDIQ